MDQKDRTKTLLEQLQATRDQTLRFFALGGSDLARTSAPGKWSVRFILHHLADAETVMFERIRRVLSEPRQVLWVFDQDAWAKGLDYERVPIEVSRRVYESVRGAILYYAGEHYERSGHLEYVHSVTGTRSLKDEFEKVASHNEKHLSQIRAALGPALVSEGRRP
jgi:DinB superfamily